MPEAFSLMQLSKLLDIPVMVLRLAILNESLACSARYAAERYAFDPVVGRDAAIEFCVTTGIDTRRLLR